MEENKGLYIFIGIALVFLLIVAVVFWQKDRIKEIFEKEEVPEEITFTSLKLQARDTYGSLIFTQYELYDNFSRMVQSGSFKEGFIEKFEDISSNATYHLRAFHSQYYQNSQECVLTQETCTVTLDRIADFHFDRIKPRVGYYLGVLYLANGTLREPLACLKWQNMVSMKIELKETKMPSNLFTLYDRCYSFSNETTNQRNLTDGGYTFGITYNPVKERENSFSIDLIDQCKGNYEEGCAKTMGFSEIVG